MAVSCALCNASIDVVFLEKIRGTWIRVAGKKRAVCATCQAGHTEDLRATLAAK